MPTTIPSHPRSLFGRLKERLLSGFRRFATALAFGVLLAGSPVPAGAVTTPATVYSSPGFSQAEAGFSFFIQQEDVRNVFSRNGVNKGGAYKRLNEDLDSFISRNTGLNAGDIAAEVFIKLEKKYEMLIAMPLRSFRAYTSKMIMRTIYAFKRKWNREQAKFAEMCLEYKVLGQQAGDYQQHEDDQCAEMVPHESARLAANDNEVRSTWLPPQVYDALTDRQRQVMELKVLWNDNKIVASILKIDPQTVKSHITKARARLAQRRIAMSFA